MADWSANQIIQGRYRLDSLLGRGGMGSVWRAEHLQLKSKVAVKRLDESIAENPDAMARFIREAQASAALRSANVVQVFDYGLDDGVAFIAMELLEGESLAERIQRLGRLSVDDTMRFMGEVLRAMSKAHGAGIVHRDLKPDNIFICRDEPEFAKILDFGVAKLTGSSAIGGSHTQTGVVIGTPYYMSPEQAQGKAIDARSDLWALGVIVYECLTGRLPFFGESFGEILVAICTAQAIPPSHVAPVPNGFNEWFARATERDRDKRFQSAKEMAGALMAVLSGTPQGSGLGWNSGEMAAVPAQTANPLSTEQRTATTRSLAGTEGVAPPKGKGALIAAILSVALVSGGALAFFLSSKDAPTSASAAGSASAEPVVAAVPSANVPPTAPSVVPEPPSLVAPVAASSVAPAAESATPKTGASPQAIAQPAQPAAPARGTRTAPSAARQPANPPAREPAPSSPASNNNSRRAITLEL
ncbi:MAG: serine/threonine-protein kinase [Polyangiaceae bacterium]